MNSINKIKEYVTSMQMYDGKWVVSVRFPPKWGAYPSEDGSIKVGPDEREPNLWYYCASNENIDIDDIIELIDETIKTNLEAIKKVELFKLKANELKQLFSDERLSFRKLQTLKFVFGEEYVDTEIKEVKEQKIKKAATKKELMSQVGEEIQEHDVFNVKDEEKVANKTKKTTRKVKNTDENKVQVAPIDMTPEEINSLRG